MFNVLKNKPRIVTRFAPSPTGLLHSGSYRTAVFSYLYARQNKGKFVLRIEDTDKERSKKEYTENILDSLNWLGLDYDEKYIQSENAPTHRKFLEQLIEEGKAFISKETPKESGDREEVIRFKNPNKKVKFEDIIRGEIEFDTTELGDFVIAKSLDEAVFHFAVVVDDWQEGITHVIRGEDHISNTPRQILIQEALGAPIPVYAHLPLVLAPDKSKLSKRNGALAVSEYRDKGYLPSALLNYIVLIGWNPGNDKEIFSKEELIKEFNLSKVQKGGAVFSEEKLRWINKEHLKIIPRIDFENVLSEKLKKEGFKDVRMSKSISNLVFERIETYGDIDLMIKNGELDCYFKGPEYDIEKIFWKDDKNPTSVVTNLLKVKELISGLPDYPKAEEVKVKIWSYAEEKGRGNVLWPLRFALSGKDKSPDPFILISVLGVKKALERIDNAIKKINSKIS